MTLEVAELLLYVWHCAQLLHCFMCSNRMSCPMEVSWMLVLLGSEKIHGRCLEFYLPHSPTTWMGPFGIFCVKKAGGQCTGRFSFFLQEDIIGERLCETIINLFILVRLDVIWFFIKSKCFSGGELLDWPTIIRNSCMCFLEHKGANSYR